MANQPLSMFVDDPAKAQPTGVAPPAGGIIAGAQGQQAPAATQPGIIGGAQTAGAASAANSVSTPDQINSIYQSQFGRNADDAGMAFWSKAAQQNPGIDLKSAILGGAQAQDRLAADDIAHGGIKAGTTWSSDLNANDVAPQKTTWDAVNNKWVAPAPTYQATQLGTPTQWNVTSDQTVQGQMKNLIDPNNPYYQQWATAGAQDAAARGFTGNSSIRDTAILDSVMRGATPIATSDAGTYAKAAGYNADMSNQFAVANQNATNQMALANLSSNTQKYLGGLSSDTQKTVAQMSNTSQQTISQAHDANTALIQSNQAAAQAYQTYVNAVANIDIQPGMDAAAKATAINTQTAIFNQAVAGLKANNSGTADMSIPLAEIKAKAADQVGGVDVSDLLKDF